MSDFTFRLTGVEQAVKRMRELPPKLQRRGARRAARAGMRIVRDAARARARQFDDPNTAQSIARLIVIQEAGRASRREGGVVMRVGVRGGAISSTSREHPWYWRLVEFGTQQIRAQPFMRPALANNVHAVTARTVHVLSESLDAGGE